MSPWTRVLLAALLVGAIAGCGNGLLPSPSGGLASPTTAATAQATTSSPAPASPAVESPTPTLETTDLTQRPFTVLILGGDDGLRTDAIIVAGIDPVNTKVSFVSLPRDTIDVPIPGGGQFRQQKVNAFYNYAASHPERFPQGPGRATADMMQDLLGVRIDFFAVTTFAGFTSLVNAMGGVRVDVPAPVVDPYYQVTSTQIGIRFKAGLQTMSGSRALIYNRTRQGDSDFARSRRQQVFLAASGQQLLGNPDLLKALLSGKSHLLTDFPLDQLPGLIVAMQHVTGADITSGLVLGPTTYSSNASCACGYALEPNLPAMRRAAAKLFPWAVITP